MLRSDANTTKFSFATKSRKYKIPLKFCETLVFLWQEEFNCA